MISALAIHHLEDADKRVLFGRVYDVLRPGGVFVNAEQVAGPTPELTRALRRDVGAHVSRARGERSEEIAAAQERRTHDRCADVESQLAWLREAGFTTADCIYKYWEDAVIVARQGGLTDEQP